MSRSLQLRRLRTWFLFAVALAFNPPGTMFAQTDVDRSLNAAPTGDSNVPDAGANDAAHQAAASTNAGANPSSPDLSGLTRTQLETRVKTLTDDLAAANADAETFRAEWQDLKLRDEALGVEALTVDQQKLEDKVVQAVKELYQTEMRRREAEQLMGKLLTSTEQLLQTAPHEDPQVRADYEVASRAAKDYLAGHNGAAIPLGNSLADGKIADLNPELNAVVLNLGKTQGVKEGMPFLIYQNSREVGTVKIVLARDLISAALVESVKPNAVLKIGDRATADVQQ